MHIKVEIEIYVVYLNQIEENSCAEEPCCSEMQTYISYLKVNRIAT